jgi:2-oxoisovalerate dehydrogenase E1 component
MNSTEHLEQMVELDWRQVARSVLQSRLLDELEESQLTPGGEVNYQFSAKGHELAQVLLAMHLNQPHDGATVYYRSRPFMLAAGLTMKEALVAGMARAGGPTEGRDVGVMFNLPPRGGLTVLPASGDVGSQYTPAAGWAQAAVYRAGHLGQAEWQGAMSVALGGDGSVAANGFWAALNVVTTLRLPMLFFIEDNAYGLSVPSQVQYPGGNIVANLQSYGNLHLLEGSGTDPKETAELIAQAVGHVRSGEGPCLLRVQVPRLTGHTFIDNQAYKTEKEIGDERRRDPVTALERHLGKEAFEEIKAEVRAELQDALEAARTVPNPDPASAPRHLFFEGLTPLLGGLRPEMGDPGPLAEVEPNDSGPRLNLIDAVRGVLEQELERNPRVLVFGEDVGLKGGVHGATLGLQSRFGDERVFDTSLSEDAIMGRSVGMALAGLLPVPEIQFRKYADPATEQINDIGTLRWRTAGKFAAPMVVRIPAGYGKKIGDPWHSVTGEAVYAHTLGWRLAFPSNAADAAGLLRAALRGDDPVIFLEHRALLDTSIARRPDPGPEYVLPFGQAAIVQPGDEMTLVTWGAMVHTSLEAAREFTGRVEVIDLRTISPWDRETVLASIRKTGKLLVVHEDTRTNGFAGEVMATVADEAFTDLDAPLRRLTTPDVPVPYNRGLMEVVVPQVGDIKSAIESLLNF